MDLFFRAFWGIVDMGGLVLDWIGLSGGMDG